MKFKTKINTFGITKNNLLTEKLGKLYTEDIIMIAGGVIPAQDYQYLYDAGVVGIFGPGTSVSAAATKILDIFIEVYS